MLAAGFPLWEWPLAFVGGVRYAFAPFGRLLLVVVVVAFCLCWWRCLPFSSWLVVVIALASLPGGGGCPCHSRWWCWLLPLLSLVG